MLTISICTLDVNDGLKLHLQDMLYHNNPFPFANQENVFNNNNNININNI